MRDMHLARGADQTSRPARRADDLSSAILDDLRRLPSISTPAVREVRCRYSQVLTQASTGLILEVARRLLIEKTWASRVVAFELVAGHRATMNRLDDRLIERMAAGLEDWGSIDLLGVTLAGPAWREGRISDERVMRWTRSADRWRRRLSLVATVPLNSKARGGTGDANRTLLVCEALAADREDMVVKALSWALRELAKREPQRVRAFLERQDARLAPRVRREVRSKLEHGRKAPPRRK